MTGASGTTGSLVVQLARKLVGPNGYVAATSSTSKMEMVKSFSPNEVSDAVQKEITLC